ncbi:unnamed protein product [Diatraea saccharalis]|uniref:Uncharacterized protein n=1 Tax=Diatraea saccharalis TaxID=40085 RepID=A0A9N9R379_9NEOP|nr:unnamed protein product [Diatraea saccharalis]
MVNKKNELHKNVLKYTHIIVLYSSLHHLKRKHIFVIIYFICFIIVDVTRPVYIRGCANERGNCEDIRKSHEGHPNIVKLLSCHECYGDKCNTNGVSKSMPDIAVALFFLIVSPLLTKHTMS